MDIRKALDQIASVRHYAVPKSVRDQASISARFGDGVIDAGEEWFVPCSHTFHAAADASVVRSLTAGTDQSAPTELVTLLGIANGARLFQLEYFPLTPDSYLIARFTILSCQQLLRTNAEMLDRFRSYAEYDAAYLQTTRLNYLAFCDVLDGNYLAISLEPETAGRVFYLDHDYGFYPLGANDTQDAYFIVAPSIASWLGDLAATRGRSGIGHQFVAI